LPDHLICRHFGACGGCSLQHLSDEAYAEAKREHVVRALKRYGVEGDVHETIRVLPRSRRRAVLKARKSNGVVALGFYAASSHVIVDMRECLVLTPTLFDAIAHLRRVLAEILAEGGTAELHVTDTDTGLDLAVRWPRRTTPALIAALSTWPAKLGAARVTLNGEVAISVNPPAVRLADVEVDLPAGGAFLQPTKAGELALQGIVCNALVNARRVADLFSGCGTFALALARRARVHAFDDDDGMRSALDRATRRASGLKPVVVEQRDLFKRPLSRRELASFDGAVLDPPRAGANAQAYELSEARVPRVAYVSCNPETFARDARTLCGKGYRLMAVTPVDQFLWSDHIDLVGVFERGSK
jgi:23S rRNA (uracil1939-C5)-methyltransferase